MRLEAVIGLFLGNIKDIYNSRASKLCKKKEIESTASRVFKKHPRHIAVIFVSSEERAVCDVMEAHDFHSIDRVEIRLNKGKKVFIYLEDNHMTYGTYSILEEGCLLHESFSWHY